ncbi:stage II sporulation protein M [Natrarchaeobius halalkaliphilus]|uniref:Stage II sporulation protein M n=1 Tax=Natrarchaeobius halalkaliphilus TaxID=1679091 RepID=A0A3N6MBG0_9EURY|nr:stage II sporulation protein M [Natrarchaeobius halalkaliphilus]RQG92801.1 stage II sporulation protein M [Natrarchaeobius halalkaliphilus]
MALSDSVSAVVAVLRRRPGDLLPMYLLGAAIPAIVRVIPFVGVLVGYLYLESTGRLEGIPEQLADLDTTPPDPDASEEAFEAWMSQFQPIVEQVVTLPLVLLVAATAIASVAVLLLLYVVIAAGQIAACAARLRDERGTTAGIAGIRRYWLRFLGLAVLEFLVWAAILMAVGTATILFIGVLALAAPVVGLLVGLLSILVLIGILAAVRALFAFAPVAVVVDDAGVFGSLSKTVGFIRRRPIEAGFYYAISVGTVLAISVVSSFLVIVEVVAFTSLLTVLVVLPALDLLKTALYANYRDRLRAPAQPERSVRTQFRDGIRRGWSEMIGFVRDTPGTHALVVALAVGSFWVGWELAGPYAGIVDASISARLEGHIPPAAALEFFGNNWLVAITTAYAGVALALPAIASLLFNGVMMGALSRLEVDPVELLTFVIPHGIFEIPAIFVASALGLWLGVVGWRAFRGRIDRPTFADALERAFWVLVGIGILLAIAGFVEGFVSPYYAHILL